MKPFAFYFGPIQQDFRDAFLLAELTLLGGIPFILRSSGQKQTFLAASETLPLLLLDPLKRKIPDLLWQEPVAKSALHYSEESQREGLTGLVQQTASLLNLGIGLKSQANLQKQRLIQRLYLFDPHAAQCLSAAQHGQITFDYAMPLDYSLENHSLIEHAMELILDAPGPAFIHYWARSRNCALYLPGDSSVFPENWKSEIRRFDGMIWTYFPPMQAESFDSKALNTFLKDLCFAEAQNLERKDLGNYHAHFSASHNNVRLFFKVEQFSWLSRLANTQAEQAAWLLNLPPGQTGYNWVLAGPFGRPESLAGINQKWADALRDSNIPYVQISDYLPYAQPSLSEQAKNLVRPSCWLSHHFPPPQQRPDVKKWAVIQPWEYGDLPASWALLWEASDALWPPSEYVAQSFLRAGALCSQVQVIPNGVDTQIYHIENSPSAERVLTRFLCVADYAWRKGLDILIRSYQSAFSQDEAVELVLKVLPSSLYSLNVERSEIQALLQKQQQPRIKIISEHLSPVEMAQLYQSADFYVHPYRGEGFGMPILEAMACGLPVIVTAGGPSLEFCSPETMWIPAQWQAFYSEIAHIGPAVGEYWYFEADQKALSQLLRQALQMPQAQRQHMALASRQQAERYDWSLIQQKIVQSVQALSAQVAVSPAESARLSWQIKDIHLSELSPVAWSWLGPEQAEWWVVEPGTLREDKKLIYWADTLNIINPDLQAFWLAADPAIRQTLISLGVAADQIGLLQAKPRIKTQIARRWQDVLDEMSSDDFHCLAYQDEWEPGHDVESGPCWWLMSWFERVFQFPESEQAWLLLAAPESQLAALENFLEAIFDALEPNCMPRVMLLEDHPRRPPQAVFEQIDAYFALDQCPNLHWVQAANDTNTRVYACGNLIPCSAPYAIPVPRGHQAFLSWHFAHLKNEWPLRKRAAFLKQELPRKLNAMDPVK